MTSQSVPVYAGKQSHLHVVGFCLAPFWQESTCGQVVVVLAGAVGAVVGNVVVTAVSHRLPVKAAVQKHWHVEARKKPPL